MKKTLLLTALICFSFTQAQIVNIPDDEFKNKLLNANLYNYIATDGNSNSIIIDINNDGEIQVSEALNVYGLDLNSPYNSDDIYNLTGIGAFINLRILACVGNQISYINVGSMKYSPFTRPLI